MKKFLVSVWHSFSEAFLKNEYIARFLDRYPRVNSFVRARLTLKQPYGRRFTVALGLGIVTMFYFSGIVYDVIFLTQWLAVDKRIMNLLAALRSFDGARIFLWFTSLASWPTVIILSLVLLLFFWYRRERRWLVYFIGSLLTTEIIYNLFKITIHRPRPAEGFSLMPWQGGYAFPSGHATIAVVLYGLIGYYLLKNIGARWWKRLIIVLAVLAVVILIGFSRLYLGVHWASDVVAGWALGFTMLAWTIAGLESKFVTEKSAPAQTGRRLSYLAVIFSMALGGAATIYAYGPLREIAWPPLKPILISESVNLNQIVQRADFPKFSESLIGEKMEPVSLVVAAQQTQLTTAFQSAGWLVADRQTPANWWRLAVAAFLNQSYPTAPVTPSFLAERPETIAFEKPTETDTVRQRHHVRFWRTDFTWGQRPLWVATASFDDGLRYLITHKIRPDIDTERDFIKDELQTTNSLKVTQELQFVQPLLGQNQGQDQFFTNGKAYLMVFK